MRGLDFLMFLHVLSMDSVMSWSSSTTLCHLLCILLGKCEKRFPNWPLKSCKYETVAGSTWDESAAESPNWSTDGNMEKIPSLTHSLNFLNFWKKAYYSVIHLDGMRIADLHKFVKSAQRKHLNICNICKFSNPNTNTEICTESENKS